MGTLKALIDAILGEDNRIAGKRFTRLAQPLLAEDNTVYLEALTGFGYADESNTTHRVRIEGEILEGGRGNELHRLYQVDRDPNLAKSYPEGTIVFDESRNQSALDHVRRGLLVDYAIGEDLDTIGRNLGLRKCRGFSQEQWREIIKTIAYLPKVTPDAVRRAVRAIFPATGPSSFEVEVYPSVRDPYTIDVFVNLGLLQSATLEGTFYLNGGEPALTTGANTVDTQWPINNVLGVYDDVPLTRYGIRDGFTNYYAGGGSFAGNTVTLGSSPGAVSTPVIVDYGAFPAHYLAEDETDTAQENRPFLHDDFSHMQCLMDQVVGAGIRVRFFNVA